MLKREEEIRDQAVLDAAREVMLAVRTAPKTRGVDKLEILFADQDEKEALAAKMNEIDERSGGKRPSFTRDAKGVMAATCLLIIGVKTSPYGLDCGWCGYPTCEAKTREKPAAPCAFAPIDLGIGAAVAGVRLADKFIDNRMMFSMGYAALELGWFGPEVKLALGFPLSVSGKNPYFDRK